jgi:type II secretory pathway pseudopilin PulG
MGQQQLLLIVLGVIIVGIAVVVGINVFTASSTQANRDAVIADLTNLASLAQQHYRKPAALGGGGQAFDDSKGGQAWEIPPQLETTGNGTYEISAISDESVTLVGTGTELGNDGTNPVKVTMIVGPNQITSTTIDN